MVRKAKTKKIVNKYDIVYERYGVYLEPHFCREWDEDGGCYGTNQDHGYTWEEGRKYLVDWHQQQIDWLNKIKEEDYY